MLPPLLVAMLLGGCEGSSATSIPPPEPGVEIDLHRATLTVESLSDCHLDPVPHHGPMPTPDHFEARAGRQSIRLRLDNIVDSCPGVPTFRLQPMRQGVEVVIVHSGTDPDGRVRDAVVVLGGIPRGSHFVRVSHSPSRTTGSLPALPVVVTE